MLLAIALGGVAGTGVRYAISRAMAVPAGSFPWATFTINVTGCFVLGALLTVMLHRWPASRYARSFATIGFLGAYTTFSTFVVEADVLTIDGHAGIAAAYVVASLVVGLAAVWIGITLARRSITRARVG